MNQIANRTISQNTSIALGKSLLVPSIRQSGIIPLGPVGAGIDLHGTARVLVLIMVNWSHFWTARVRQSTYNGKLEPSPLPSMGTARVRQSTYNGKLEPSPLQWGRPGFVRVPIMVNWGHLPFNGDGEGSSEYL